MGSVEFDELMYDGGDRLATAAQIEMEYEEARLEARERIERLLDERDDNILTIIAESCDQAWKEAARLLALGQRQKAEDMWCKAVDDAIEQMIREAV